MKHAPRPPAPAAAWACAFLVAAAAASFPLAADAKSCAQAIKAATTACHKDIGRVVFDSQARGQRPASPGAGRRPG
jgi:hypothetical protein